MMYAGVHYNIGSNIIILRTFVLDSRIMTPRLQCACTNTFVVYGYRLRGGCAFFFIGILCGETFLLNSAKRMLRLTVVFFSK